MFAERVSEDQFEVAFCSSSYDALQYMEPALGGARLTNRYRLGVVFPVPRERLIDPGTLINLLLSPRVQQLQTSTKHYFDVQVPELAGGRLHDIIEKHKDKQPAFCKPRRSGSDNHRSVLNGIRYVAERRGLNAEQRKKLMLGIRAQYLLVARGQLEWLWNDIDGKPAPVPDLTQVAQRGTTIQHTADQPATGSGGGGGGGSGAGGEDDAIQGRLEGALAAPKYDGEGEPSDADAAAMQAAVDAAEGGSSTSLGSKGAAALEAMQSSEGGKEAAAGGKAGGHGGKAAAAGAGAGAGDEVSAAAAGVKMTASKSGKEAAASGEESSESGAVTGDWSAAGASDEAAAATGNATGGAVGGADAVAGRKLGAKAAKKLAKKEAAKAAKRFAKTSKKVQKKAMQKRKAMAKVAKSRIQVGTRGFLEDSEDEEESGPTAMVTAPKPKPKGLAEFEARLLEIAVRGTARAAMKLREKGYLDDHSLANVRELTHVVKSFACRMDAEDALHLTVDEAREFESEEWWKDRPKRLMQPELHLTGPVKSKPLGYHGFDHLADLRDTTIFQGHDTSTGAEPFPNLLEGPQPARMPDGRPAFPGNFHDARGVLERAVTHCRGIFSRGNSVAKEAVGVDVVALFEELFLERLPCPFPWHEVVDSRARHRGGEQAVRQRLSGGVHKELTEYTLRAARLDPWQPQRMSLTDQRAVLGALFELLQMYVTARYMVGSRPAEVAQVYTAASVCLACWNAVAMTRAEGPEGTLAVTRALRGDIMSGPLRPEEQGPAFFFDLRSTCPGFESVASITAGTLLTHPGAASARPCVQAYYTALMSGGAEPLSRWFSHPRWHPMAGRWILNNTDPEFVIMDWFLRPRTAGGAGIPIPEAEMPAVTGEGKLRQPRSGRPTRCGIELRGNSSGRPLDACMPMERVIAGNIRDWTRTSSPEVGQFRDIPMLMTMLQGCTVPTPQLQFALGGARDAGSSSTSKVMPLMNFGDPSRIRISDRMVLWMATTPGNLSVTPDRSVGYRWGLFRSPIPLLAEARSAANRRNEGPWVDAEMDQLARDFAGRGGSARDGGEFGGPMAGARPGGYEAVGPWRWTESEDVVVRSYDMPSFEGALSPEDGEHLLQALCVPYLRIPLVLRFMARRGASSLCSSPGIRALLERVLFEPREFFDSNLSEPPAVRRRRQAQARYRVADARVALTGPDAEIYGNAEDENDAEVEAIEDDAYDELARRAADGAPSGPDVAGVGRGSDEVRRAPLLTSEERSCLGTKEGLLMNELRRAPAGIVGPLLELAHEVEGLTTPETADAMTENLLFFVQLLSRVEGFLVLIAKEASARSRFGWRLAEDPDGTNTHEARAQLARLRLWTLGAARRKMMLLETQLLRKASQRSTSAGVGAKSGSNAVTATSGAGSSESKFEGEDDAADPSEALLSLEAKLAAGDIDGTTNDLDLLQQIEDEFDLQKHQERANAAMYAEMASSSTRGGLLPADADKLAEIRAHGAMLVQHLDDPGVNMGVSQAVVTAVGSIRSRFGAYVGDNTRIQAVQQIAQRAQNAVTRGRRNRDGRGYRSGITGNIYQGQRGYDASSEIEFGRDADGQPAAAMMLIYDYGFRGLGGTAPFAALARLRHRICQVVGTAGVAARSQLCESLAASVLAQQPTPGALWLADNTAALRCQVVVETPHPYLPGDDYIYVLRCPGAPFLILRFDERTSLYPGDVAHVFRDEACTSVWGPVTGYRSHDSALTGRYQQQRSGGDMGFPGVGTNPPLVVPTDRCVVRLRASPTMVTGSERFGVRIVVEAPVSPHAASRVFQAIKGPGVSTVAGAGEAASGAGAGAGESKTSDGDDPEITYTLCEAALSLTNNDEEAAEKLIREDPDRAHEALAVAGAAADAIAQGTPGLFRDQTGATQVSLQSAEVKIGDSVLQRVPTYVAGSKEWVDMAQTLNGFQQAQPTMLGGIKAETDNMTTFEVRFGGSRYLAECWHGPAPMHGSHTMLSAMTKLPREALYPPSLLPFPIKEEVNAGMDGAMGRRSLRQRGGVSQQDRANWQNLQDDVLPDDLEKRLEIASTAGLGSTAEEAAVVPVTKYGTPISWRGVMFFQGQRFSQRYEPEQCGWVGRLVNLDKPLGQWIDTEVVLPPANPGYAQYKPSLWTASWMSDGLPEAMAAAEEEERAFVSSGKLVDEDLGAAPPVLGRVLLFYNVNAYNTGGFPYAIPDNTLQGHWIEIQVLGGRGAGYRSQLQMFILTESGRRVSRKLMFATDRRFSLEVKDQMDTALMQRRKVWDILTKFRYAEMSSLTSGVHMYSQFVSSGRNRAVGYAHAVIRRESLATSREAALMPGLSPHEQIHRLIGSETFVSCYELEGVLPAVLTRYYAIWRIMEQAEEARVGEGEAAMRDLQEEGGVVNFTSRAKRVRLVGYPRHTTTAGSPPPQSVKSTVLYIEIRPVTYAGVRETDPLVLKSDPAFEVAATDAETADAGDAELQRQETGNDTAVLPPDGAAMRELGTVQITEVEAQIRRFEAPDFVEFWLREQDAKANAELRKAKIMLDDQAMSGKGGSSRGGSSSTLMMKRAESVADKTDPTRASDADEAAKRMRPIMCDQLVNPMRSRAGSPVARMFDAFVRVQSAGDTLFWSHGDSARPAFQDCDGSDGLVGEGYAVVPSHDVAVTHVELPGLELRFNIVPVTPDVPGAILAGSGGDHSRRAFRAECRELAGRFLSDRRPFELGAMARWNPNSLLLEDREGKLSVLVPNTTDNWLQVVECPFLTARYPDLGALARAPQVDKRYHLLGMHDSLAFPLTPSAEASLFLLRQALFARDTRAAHGILPACAIDDVCSAREKALLMYIAFNAAVSSDMYPDALTVRMKIWIYLSRLLFGVAAGDDPKHNLFKFITAPAANSYGGVAQQRFQQLHKTLYDTFDAIYSHALPSHEDELEMHRNFFLTQHQGRLVAALMHATEVGKTAVVKASKAADAGSGERVLGQELIAFKSMEDAKVLQAVSGASPAGADDESAGTFAASGAGASSSRAGASRFITPLIPVQCSFTSGYFASSTTIPGERFETVVEMVLPGCDSCYVRANTASYKQVSIAMYYDKDLRLPVTAASVNARSLHGKPTLLMDRSLNFELPGDRLYVVVRCDTKKAQYYDWRTTIASCNFSVVMSGFAPAHACMRRYETDVPQQGLQAAPTGTIRSISLADDGAASPEAAVGGAAAGPGGSASAAALAAAPAKYTVQGFREHPDIVHADKHVWSPGSSVRLLRHLRLSAKNVQEANAVNAWSGQALAESQSDLVSHEVVAQTFLQNASAVEQYSTYCHESSSDTMRSRPDMPAAGRVQPIVEFEVSPDVWQNGGQMLDQSLRGSHFQWHGAVDRHRHNRRSSEAGMHRSYDTEAEVRHHATYQFTNSFFQNTCKQSVGMVNGLIASSPETVTINAGQIIPVWFNLLGLLHLKGLGCKPTGGKPDGLDVPFWLPKSYRRHFIQSSCFAARTGGSMANVMLTCETIMRLVDKDLDEAVAAGRCVPKRELMHEWRFSRYGVQGFTLQPNVHEGQTMALPRDDVGSFSDQFGPPAGTLLDALARCQVLLQQAVHLRTGCQTSQFTFTEGYWSLSYWAALDRVVQITIDRALRMHHLNRPPADFETQNTPTLNQRVRMVDVIADQPRPPQPRLDTLCDSREARLPYPGSSAISSDAEEPFELLRRRVLSGNGADTYNNNVLMGAMDARESAPEGGYMLNVAAPGSPAHPNGAWSDKLPFDINGAAEAESAVGREMLARLMEDTQKSSKSADGATRKLLRLLHGGPTEALKSATEPLGKESLKKLLQLRLDAAKKRKAGTSEERPAGSASGADDEGAQGEAIELALGAVDVASTVGPLLDSKSMPAAGWLAHADTIAATWRALVELEKEIVAVREDDQAAISAAIADACCMFNDEKRAPTTTAADVNAMYRIGGERDRTEFVYAVGAVVSVRGDRALQRLNPSLSLPSCRSALEAVSAIVMRSLRSTQASRSIAQARSVRKEIERALATAIKERYSASLLLEAMRSGSPASASSAPRTPSSVTVRRVLEDCEFNPQAAVLALRAWGSAYIQLADAILAQSPDVAMAGASGPAAVAAATQQACLALDTMALERWAELAASGPVAAGSTATMKHVESVVSLLDGCVVDGKRIARHTWAPKPGARDPFAVLTAAGHSLDTLGAAGSVLEATGKALSDMMSASRRYMFPVEDSGAATGDDDFRRFHYDPRFLAFEFATGFVLRGRQVQTIQEFKESVEVALLDPTDPARKERVANACKQLLMGAGKSTVLSPCLSVMLADGQSMVTQVMPASLLDMSRRVTRAVLSAPFLRRMVLTFHFERFSLPSLRSMGRALAMDRQARERPDKLFGPQSVRGAAGGHPMIDSSLRGLQDAHPVEGFGYEERDPTNWVALGATGSTSQLPALPTPSAQVSETLQMLIQSDDVTLLPFETVQEMAMSGIITPEQAAGLVEYHLEYTEAKTARDEAIAKQEAEHEAAVKRGAESAAGGAGDAHQGLVRQINSYKGWPDDERSIRLSFTGRSVGAVPLMDCEDSFKLTVRGWNANATATAVDKILCWVSHLQRQVDRLRWARDTGNVVAATPESIKSAFLQYMDLLQQVRAAPPHVFIPPETIMDGELRWQVDQEAVRVRALDALADVLRDLMSLWGERSRGCALIDEIDVCMHPLKSELNYPVGQKDPLAMSPDRWNLPMHMIGGFLACCAPETLAAGGPPPQVPGESNEHVEPTEEIKKANEMAHTATPGMDEHQGKKKRRKRGYKGKKTVTEEMKRSRKAEQQRKYVEDEQRRRAQASGPRELPPGACGPGSGPCTPADILIELRDELRRGIAMLAIQTTPHITLLDPILWHTRLKRPVAKWTMMWLLKQESVQQDFQTAEAAEASTGASESKEAGGAASGAGADDDSAADDLEETRDFYRKKWAFDGELCSNALDFMVGEAGASSKQAANIRASCSAYTIQLLNLARDHCNLFAPHYFSRVDRVSYGLLHEGDPGFGQKDSRGLPTSRAVLAVPFVGRETPSKNSEFAHPDIYIGLAVMAYRYEGMRYMDMLTVLQALKSDLSRETGRPEERPAARLFQKWLDEAASAEEARRDYAADGMKIVQLARKQSSTNSLDDQEGLDSSGAGRGDGPTALAELIRLPSLGLSNGDDDDDSDDEDGGGRRLPFAITRREMSLDLASGGASDDVAPLSRQASGADPTLDDEGIAVPAAAQALLEDIGGSSGGQPTESESKAEEGGEVALRQGTQGSSKATAMEVLTGTFDKGWLEEGHANAKGILPLPLVDMASNTQLQAIHAVLASSPSVILYYLRRMVFPAVMQHQHTKLTATGLDVCGDTLFLRRAAFSGTPSNILPQGMLCEYEPGSDAKILRILADPRITTPFDGDLSDWSVRGLLVQVAQANFDALIDTGALITGMSNEETARFLLKSGLRRKEGCVFIDETGKHKCVMRSTGRVVDLADCGLDPVSYSVFFDYYHTTGQDIKLNLDARAAVTLSKDMTLRDYAQGCWRMRGLERGYRLSIIAIPEVRRLIRAVASTDSLTSDILAWLVTNSIRSEHMQRMQLTMQHLSAVWRRAAIRDVQAMSAPQGVEVAAFVAPWAEPYKLPARRSSMWPVQQTQSVPLRVPAISKEPIARLDIRRLVAGVRTKGITTRFQRPTAVESLPDQEELYSRMQVARTVKRAAPADALRAAQSDPDAAAKMSGGVVSTLTSIGLDDSAIVAKLGPEKRGSRCVQAYLDPLRFDVAGTIDPPVGFKERLQVELQKWTDLVTGHEAEARVKYAMEEAAAAARDIGIIASAEVKHVRKAAMLAKKEREAAGKEALGDDPSSVGAEAEKGDEAELAAARTLALDTETVQEQELQQEKQQEKEQEYEEEVEKEVVRAGADRDFAKNPRQWSLYAMAAPSGEGATDDRGTMGKHVVVKRSEWLLTKDIRLWEDMYNVNLPTSMYSTWNHTPPTSFVYTMPMWPLKNVVVIMRWKPAGSSGNARVLPEHLRGDQDDSDSEDEERHTEQTGGATQTAVGARVSRAVWAEPAADGSGAVPASEQPEQEKPWCLATINLEEAAAVRRAMHLRNPFLIDARDVTRTGSTLHAAVVQLWTTDGRLLDERTDDPRHPQGEFEEQVEETSVLSSKEEGLALIAGSGTSAEASAPAAAGAEPPATPDAASATAAGSASATAEEDNDRVLAVQKGRVVGLTRVDKWELPTQSARYFDLQVAYTEVQLAYLMAGLSESSPEDRAAFFSRMQTKRRRETVGYEVAPISPALSKREGEQFSRMRSIASRVRMGLARQFGGVTAALEGLGFGSGSNYLPPSALQRAILGLLAAEIKPEEVAELLMHTASADGAGFISRSLFTATLIPPDPREQKLNVLNQTDSESAKSTRRVARYLAAVNKAMDAREEDARAEEEAQRALEDLLNRQGKAAGPKELMQLTSGGGAFQSEGDVAPPLERQGTYAGEDALHLQARRYWDIGEPLVTSGGPALVRGGVLVSSPNLRGSCVTIAPRATVLAPDSGMHYFEATVIRCNSAGGHALPPQAGATAVPATDRSEFPCGTVGFALASFKGSVRTGIGAGMGGEDSGVALGADGCVWVAGRKLAPVAASEDVQTAGIVWKTGDVIGAAFDCTNGAAVFTVNGSVVGTCGNLPEGCPRRYVGSDDEQAELAGVCLVLSGTEGVLPVVSMDAAVSLELNFGDASFRYNPPFRTAGSVYRQIERLREVRLVRAVGLAAGQPIAAQGSYGVQTRPDGSVFIDASAATTQVGLVGAAELRGIAIHRGKWYFEVDVLDPVGAGMMSRAESMACEGTLAQHVSSTEAVARRYLKVSMSEESYAICKAMVPSFVQVGFAARDHSGPVNDNITGNRGRLLYGLSHPAEYGERLRMTDLPVTHAHLPMLKAYHPDVYIRAFSKFFGHTPTDADMAQMYRDVHRRRRRYARELARARRAAAEAMTEEQRAARAAEEAARRAADDEERSSLLAAALAAGLEYDEAQRQVNEGMRARREAESVSAGGSAGGNDGDDEDDEAEGGADFELDDISNEVEPFPMVGATAGFGADWASPGNTIGVCIDMSTGTISMGLNGKWDGPWGLAYHNVRPGPMGLTPAVTLHAPMAVRFNIGQRRFKHAPPSDSYKPVGLWIVERSAAYQRQLGTRSSLVRGYEKQLAAAAAAKASADGDDPASASSVDIELSTPPQLMRAESHAGCVPQIQAHVESGKRLPLFAGAQCGTIVKINQDKGTVASRSGVDLAENPEQAMSEALQSRVTQATRHRRRAQRRHMHRFGGGDEDATADEPTGDEEHPTILVGMVSLPTRDRASGGIVVYELRVLEEGAAAIGWAAGSFFGFAAGHHGIGDDMNSIGLSVRRRAVIHGGDVVRPVPSMEIGKGDLIRCAFDTSSGTCYYQVVPAQSDADGGSKHFEDLTDEEKSMCLMRTEWVGSRSSLPAACSAVRPAVTLRGVSFKFELRTGSPADPLLFGSEPGATAEFSSRLRWMSAYESVQRGAGVAVSDGQGAGSAAGAAEGGAGAESDEDQV